MTVNLDPATSPTLSVEDCAIVLGIGRSSAYAGVHSGQIPSIRIGKRIRVSTVAIRRMLELEPRPEVRGAGVREEWDSKS
jgi:excisionase family DNA binding protein